MNRSIAQAKAESAQAIRHYAQPHDRIVFGCPECAHHAAHWLYRWSSIYFPKRDVRKFFRVTPSISPTALIGAYKADRPTP